MIIEKISLAISIILGIAHLGLVTFAKTAHNGIKWNLSSRDAASPALPVKTARLDRSFQNFKETYVFFVAALLLCLYVYRSSPLSEISAVVYIVCRLIYIPLYVFNVTTIRSIVWITSMAAIVGLLAHSLIGTVI